jgi:L-cystine uptake protein TcyP (sodium:dicarboxylate symporter family)
MKNRKHINISKRVSITLELGLMIGVAIALVKHSSSKDYILLLPFLIITIDVNKKKLV